MSEMTRSREEVRQFLKASKIVLVVRRLPARHLIPAIDAAHSGGINVVEITMDDPSAAPAIQALCDRFDGVLVGAGTVLREEQAHAAIAAGASFLVSPVLDPRIIALARKHSLAAVPGAMTPTEIFQAQQAGADMIKIFPAGILTAQFIRDVRGPFGPLDLMVTGSIGIDNVAEFFKVGVSAVGIGKGILDEGALQTGNYQVIEEKARLFCQRVFDVA